MNREKRKFISSFFGALILICSLNGCGFSEKFMVQSKIDSNTNEIKETIETVITDVETEVVEEYLQRNTGLEEIGATAVLEENSSITKAKSPIRTVKNKDLSGQTLSDDFYMYRNVLSVTEKKAYDQICLGVLSGVNTINLSVAVTTSSIENVFYSVYYDHPEFLWLDSGFSYSYNNNSVVTSLSPVYNRLSSDIKGSAADFENAINPVLNAASSYQNVIDKVRFIHDYLAYSITYLLNSDLNQSGYSAVANRITVCAGYAHAFQYCMMKLGIPCAYITGDANGSHAWNILKLDGDYYCMDVTWDDPVGGNEYVSYEYFCITDSQISSDHSRYSLSAKLPSSDGTKYSYSNYYNSGYGSDFEIIDWSKTTFGDGLTPPIATTMPETTTQPSTTTPYSTSLYELDDDFNMDDYTWDDFDWDTDYDLEEDDFDWDSYYNYYDDYDWSDFDDFDWDGSDYDNYNYDDDYWSDYWYDNNWDNYSDDSWYDYWQ